MKKTRLVALVALVAVCIAGWTVLGMNAVSEVKTQKDTVAAAGILPRQKAVPAFASELHECNR